MKKLVFDSRKDSDALQHIYGVKLQGVLDIQLLLAVHTAAGYGYRYQEVRYI